jgi:Holliday junction DNA helicase RuvA
MYSYFNGTLTEKTADMVVIDCAGVGYELKIPLSTFDLLPALNETVKLFVHYYHNDDGTKLFGFFSKQEKDIFKLLINVNGIGPKSALSLMSAISIKDLLTAIVTQNHLLIAKAPGFGKKTAERLIVELKDKIEDISEIEMQTSNVTEPQNSSFNSNMWSEVESALIALGFKPIEIRKTLQSVQISDSMSIEEIVKTCIKYIYLKRNDA